VADLLVLVESNTTGTGRLFAERVRDLGLVPVLLSADARRYPYAAELGLDVRHCQTASEHAVLAACRHLAAQHRVAGVTSSSDYFVATAAGVARALGRPGPDPKALAAARDKGNQRRCFAAHGVDSPAFRLVTSAAQAGRAAADLGPPVVVKPVSRSGSIGVRRCDTVRAAADHAAGLLATTTDERGNPLPAEVLVESYLDGPELSVELFDGRVRAVVGKHLDPSRGFLEVGHDVPASLDAGTADLLGHVARAALRALGLRWGAAHVELRLVGGRAFVVEVNPRLAGGMIPQALRHANGTDLIAELVAAAAGVPPAPAAGSAGHAAIRFLVPAADGRVTAVPDPAGVRARPGVVDAAVTARPGQRVERRGTFLDRVGHVIAIGPTPREAGTRADRAVAALAARLTVDPVPDPKGARA
jgi:biotin carboxylase